MRRQLFQRGQTVIWRAEPGKGFEENLREEQICSLYQVGKVVRVVGKPKYAGKTVE